MAEQTHIYEAADVTNDEVYWTLGVWLTLEDALADIDKCKVPSDASDQEEHEYYEHCKIEIRERVIGWPSNDGGKVVAVRQWYLTYDDEGECVWTKAEEASQ